MTHQYWPGRLREKQDPKLLTLEILKPPMMPVSTNRLLRAATCDCSGGMEMAEEIANDQFLSGDILRIANSTHFGLSQQVPTVSRAILVLGFEAVKSIALSASVIRASCQGRVHSRLDLQSFWAHSLACAYLSRKITGMTHLAELETTFVCGLLHDIGKIMIDMFFPNSYRRVLARLASSPVTSVQAEDEVLGFTHAEVGMWLAQHWRFPKAVIFTIANHHGIIADDAEYRSLALTVRLANHLCLQAGVGPAEQSSVEPLEDSVLDNLKLDFSDLEELKNTLAARKEALVSLSSR